MLNAHMDTVGVAGMTDPFVPRTRGRTALRARRAGHEGESRGVHARGGRREATSPARRRDRDRRRRRGVREHRDGGDRGDALRRRCDRDGADGSAGLQSRIAASSISRSRCTGRAAHGSRPDLGIDAIAKMGRVLVGIEELDRTTARRTEAPVSRKRKRPRVADRGRAGVLELPGALSCFRPSGGRSRARPRRWRSRSCARSSLAPARAIRTSRPRSGLRSRASRSRCPKTQEIVQLVRRHAAERARS